MLVRFAFTNVWHHDIEQLTVWEAIKGIGNSLSEGKNHFSNLFSHTIVKWLLKFDAGSLRF